MKIQIEHNIIRNMLKDVYFINGTAYAGKSTMVKLLAEKYDGICCGENYHDALMDAADPVLQPNLCYFQTMSGWEEFVTRTPEEYDAWINGVSAEAAEMEIALLLRLSAQNRKIFVDTNIPPSILQNISDEGHVAFMVAPQTMSVEHFFERNDPEKRFLLGKIMELPDAEAVMANYKNCIARLNSPEHHREFTESGFYVYYRTESSTIADALAQLERHFNLA